MTDRVDRYLPRVADEELRRRLAASGAVVVEGPKACGKTETARRHAKSEVLLDIEPAARRAANVDPGLVLDGPVPRLIDEWQIEPHLWNHVRRTVDERRETGQFILTGSSVPPHDVARHTGAGRFSFLTLRPMTLFESGRSDGAVSLGALFDGNDQSSKENPLSISALIDAIVVGGWPAQHGRSPTAAGRSARDYLTQIVRVDAARVAGGTREPAKLSALLRSLARNTATEASITTLAAHSGGADGALARDTVYDYLDVLGRLMVIEDQPAWSTHLRSKATLRSASKRHFIDPSLAVAALGTGPTQLIADLGYVGCLFESTVVRDLRVLSQPFEGTVYHFRDSNGLEVDAIIELADGRWAAIEVKLGSRSIDQAAANLLRFVHTVDTDVIGHASFLGVVTPSGYAYRREDGVHVIPASSLGP